MVLLAAVWTVGTAEDKDKSPTFPARGEDQGDQKARLAEIERQVDVRRREISRELATLPNHAWAGEYRQGDGAINRLTLSLAPNSGAVFKWDACLGTMWQNHGKISEKNGRIKVRWEDSLAGVSEEYLVVRWGERHYLVPPEDVLDFCGQEEDSSGVGDPRESLYFRRLGDDTKKRDGDPKVPAGFEKYVKLKFIRAAVTAVDPTKEEPSSGGQSRGVTQSITINAGEAEGVLPKMRFAVIEPKDSFVRVKVTRVKDHESEAVATSWYDPKTHSAESVKVDWKVRAGHE